MQGPHTTSTYGIRSPHPVRLVLASVLGAPGRNADEFDRWGIPFGFGVIAVLAGGIEPPLEPLRASWLTDGHMSPPSRSRMAASSAGSSSPARTSATLASRHDRVGRVASHSRTRQGVTDDSAELLELLNTVGLPPDYADAEPALAAATSFIGAAGTRPGRASTVAC